MDPGTAMLIAAGAGFIGQQQTNAANVDLGHDQMAFQERMSNTAYQRQVKDMEAAGLNPMLSYLKGGGASTPPGAMPQVQNPYSAGISSGYSASQASLTSKQAPKLEAETENIGADTILKRANTFYALAQEKLSFASAAEKQSHVALMESQAHKIAAEVKNIPLEGDRLVAVVKQLEASVSLINKQTTTEEQRVLQMTALAVKTLTEADLLLLDKAAIDKADNLGKEFGQYKPIIDTIMSIIRILTRK